MKKSTNTSHWRTLDAYLSRRLRAWNRWLQHPERSDDVCEESSIQDDIAHFENVREEIKLMRRLGSPSMIALLKAECRVTFSTLDIQVGANYSEGSGDNRLQIFNDRGVIAYQEPFTPDGLARAFSKVEEDVLARLKKDYPSAD